VRQARKASNITTDCVMNPLGVTLGLRPGHGQSLCTTRAGNCNAMQPCFIMCGMKYQQLTFRLDGDICDRLTAISAEQGRSRGELVRRALRSHYGIAEPRGTLAAALPNAKQLPHADAPWLNGDRHDS
jgi:hypothetical protein